MSEITILSDAEIDAVSGAWGTFNYTYNTMNFTIIEPVVAFLKVRPAVLK